MHAWVSQSNQSMDDRGSVLEQQQEKVLKLNYIIENFNEFHFLSRKFRLWRFLCSRKITNDWNGRHSIKDNAWIRIDQDGTWFFRGDSKGWRGSIQANVILLDRTNGRVDGRKRGIAWMENRITCCDTRGRLTRSSSDQSYIHTFILQRVNGMVFWRARAGAEGGVGVKLQRTRGSSTPICDI